MMERMRVAEEENDSDVGLVALDSDEDFEEI